MTAGCRVLLLAPARSYRAADFVLAATRMGVDLTVASDGALLLGGRPVIRVRPGDPARSAELIASRSGLVDAVVAADAPMLPLAAAVAARLGLPHNPVGAVLAAADKARQRQCWSAASVAQPWFQIVPDQAPDPAIRQAAAAIGFPCVIKAVSLSASQGVLRADNADQAVQAAARIRRVLAGARHPAGEPLLVEEYLHGAELRTGPVHAELRVTTTGPAMLELAARSIGGLCSRALRFPSGRSLEELILASALGEPVPASADQAPQPSGVFMLPVPRAGVLRAVEGRADAEAVPGITGVTITIPPGRRLRPLPDGDQYLGFIFAEAATPGDVEKALTTASRRLRAVIE